MTTDTKTQTLTQLKFEGEDFDKAETIAKALGYKQTAYTSTSALWGLFCLPENPATAKPGQRTDGGCIIKTRELGFLFVQDGEDTSNGYDWNDVTDKVANYGEAAIKTAEQIDQQKAAG